MSTKTVYDKELFKFFDLFYRYGFLGGFDKFMVFDNILYFHSGKGIFCVKIPVTMPDGSYKIFSAFKVEGPLTLESSDFLNFYCFRAERYVKRQDYDKIFFEDIDLFKAFMYKDILDPGLFYEFFRDFLEIVNESFYIYYSRVCHQPLIVVFKSGLELFFFVPHCAKEV